MNHTFSFEGADVARLIPFTHPDVTATDTLEPVEPGVWRLVRTFTPKGADAVPAAELAVECQTLYAADFLMVPAVNYNGNPFGDGKEPVGFEHEGQPWSYAFHRTAVPGGTFSRNKDRSFGLFGDRNASSCGFSCSLFRRGGQAVHRLIAPEEEMPRSYLKKGSLADGYREEVMVSHEHPVVLTAYLVASRGDDHAFLDFAWRKNFETVTPWFDEAAIWDLGIEFAQESLWCEDGDFRGFSIGLSYDEKAGGWKRERHYEAGWCGQNISLGCALLKDFLLRHRKISLERGLAALDAWTCAMLPSGLLCTHYDGLLGFSDMASMRIDGCNLGHAAEHFLEAWDLAARCGTDRPAYREAAERILHTAMQAQNEDGAYPSAFFPDGSVATYEGSTGGFFLPAMLALYGLTSDADLLASAVRAFNWYNGQFAARGYSTAGALDTYCIDKESAIPLLSAALLLQTATGKPEYLDAAVEAAYYLATWQWHHSTAYPEGTALHTMAYRTFGGTAVSTQHHHIDAYALRAVPDLLVLAERTGSDLWRQRAAAIWDNATIGISDGTLAVMGRVRPRGGQDEAFLHTRWANPFQVSEWLVAWPTAMRLEVLRKRTSFTGQA